MIPVRAPVSDQMEYTPYTFPPGNASISSSVLSLCPSAATLFFLPSAYTLLFLTALPGNVLSLWVFQRCISTASPIHVYLSHLSISNLMLSVTMPFLAAYFALGSSWMQSGFLCQLVLHGITPVFHININISMTILTLVALSRFAAIIRHTHASRQSGCVTLLPHGFFARLTRASFASRVCAGVWVVAVGGTVPVTVYYSVKEAVSGEAPAKDGCVEVCYNPAVEIGGSFSAMLAVPVITLFFVFYLLVLISYMTVLRHIKRSRRSTKVTTSQRLLGRVLRNIVVIQVVLSVCLLPHHIFKPIFLSLIINQRLQMYSPGPDICNSCHPLSTFVEVTEYHPEELPAASGCTERFN
ncbi:probable G-protein coupled receptor 82 isoform X2 [Anoplopoma fimbria]|uniref:probable G-protein coupled receptor 82 isoform X2 n=1 Tax=Anoplopoma fimbria TaxID=229290 RepID=UPI0023EDDC55|nr:probable G-protein coupled receptor 82 isoform X2 [Anoplopoma fimbria]